MDFAIFAPRFGQSLRRTTMELYSIDTGFFKLDGGAMFGVVPRTLWSKLHPPDERNLCTWAMRCLLVEDGDRLMLIETINFTTTPEDMLEWLAGWIGLTVAGHDDQAAHRQHAPQRQLQRGRGHRHDHRHEQQQADPGRRGGGAEVVHLKPGGPLDCSDGQVLYDWCLAGHGIAWRSTWEVEHDIAAGRLRVLLASDADSSRYDARIAHDYIAHRPYPQPVAQQIIARGALRADVAARGAAATRQLAKRQITWLTNSFEAEIFDCLDPALTERVAARTAGFLADRLAA